jgi:hypothetical protein
MKKERIERCPMCRSLFIQYDENTDECYCLVKSCNHRWKMDIDFLNIKNPYLRNSIKHISGGDSSSDKTFQKLCDDLDVVLWKGMEIGKWVMRHKTIGDVVGVNKIYSKIYGLIYYFIDRLSGSEGEKILEDTAQAISNLPLGGE